MFDENEHIHPQNNDEAPGISTGASSAANPTKWR